MNCVKTVHWQSTKPQKYFLISLGPQCWIENFTWRILSSRKHCKGSDPSSCFLLGIYKPTLNLWREFLQSTGSALERVLCREDSVVRERRNQMPCTSQICFQLCCSGWVFEVCYLHPFSLAFCIPGILQVGEGVRAGGQRCFWRGTACAQAEVSEGECPGWVLVRTRMRRDSIPQGRMGAREHPTSAFMKCICWVWGQHCRNWVSEIVFI